MDSSEKSGGIDSKLLLSALEQRMPSGRDTPTGFAESGSTPHQPSVGLLGASTDLPSFRHGELVASSSPLLPIKSGRARKAIDDTTAEALKALMGNWVAGGDACPHAAPGSQAEPLQVLGAKAPIARTPLREDLDELDRKYATVLARLGDAIRALGLVSRGQDYLSAGVRALGRIERALKRPCRFVILGECNSGKSTLANVLLGSAILPTDVLSNTRIPTLLCHSAHPHVSACRPNGELQPLNLRAVETANDLPYLCVGLPIPSLKTLEIVDLPGLGEQRAHAQETLLRAHRADIALWCTIGIQAWKTSERAYWASQPVWLKSRSLLVVTHGDLLESSADAEKLVARLRMEAAGEFRDVVLLSALDSLALGNDATDWAACGVHKLDALLLALAFEVRTRRIEAAMRICSSISKRVMTRL